MAVLHIPSLSAGDPEKLTISMWCQFTSDAVDSQPILAAGSDYVGFQDAAAINNINFGVEGKIRPLRALQIYRSNFYGADTIVVDIAGRASLNPLSFDLGSGDTPLYWQTNDQTVDWGPVFGYVRLFPGTASDTADASTNPISGLVAPLIAAGNWFHLFISIDFSYAEKPALVEPIPYMSQAKKCYFLINNLDYGLGNQGAMFDPTGTFAARNGSVQSFFYHRDINATAGNSWPTVENNCVWAYKTEQFQSGSSGGPVTGTDGVENWQPSAWAVALDGHEFSLPCRQSEFDFNTAGIRYGDVQVWFDTYVDPTVQMNKFVNRVGGIATPADPAIAAAAFGTPTLRFKGAAASFVTNDGSTGTTSATGTISDFATLPSYTY